MTSALADSSAAFPKAGDKLPPQTFGPFDMPHLARYADVSGDTNPIHLDAALAQQAGLAAPPVQGMLLMGAFEPALAAWQPNLVLQRLSAKFLRPVLAGESIVVSGRVGSVAGGRVTLRLMAHNAQREIVVLGEAALIAASGA
ncbi:acyl dehydratase [Methylovirgula ligni]|uniref:Acyl dehydratase n=1 Tax=Methylovirgula ligni TaxID=569860 RepID=A0A3D9YYG0_9HYPH|nr:MaoC family dehydratase [Methylovirgula ligni]REF87794.1 acyl dehydratase [Methylovirgula ligni]